jgi:hypothetical protein
VTRLQADWWIPCLCLGARGDFPAHHFTKLVLRPIHPPVGYICIALSVGLKLLGHEYNGWSPSRAKCWGNLVCASVPPHVIHGQVLRLYSYILRELGYVLFRPHNCLEGGVAAVSASLLDNTSGKCVKCDGEMRTVNVTSGKKEMIAERLCSV